MIYEFTPTQDLHGYEKPWAPGAGSNLLDPEILSDTRFYTVNPDGSITITSSDGRSWADITDVLDLPAGTYMIAKTPSTGTSDIRLSTEEYGTPHVFTSQLQFTLSEDGSIKLKLAYSAQTYPSTQKVQIVSGTTVPAWTPYSNICPPEGFNIWDPPQEEMIPVYSGYVDANANKLYLHPVYEEYDGEELVGPWMSSMDKYTEEGTPTTGAFVVDFGGEVSEYDITDFMLQTLLDSLGVRRFITSGAMLLNSLMDQAQGRVRSEEELLNRSLPLHVIAIGEDLPTNLVIKRNLFLMSSRDFRVKKIKI